MVPRLQLSVLKQQTAVGGPVPDQQVAPLAMQAAVVTVVVVTVVVVTVVVVVEVVVELEQTPLIQWSAPKAHCPLYS